MSSPGISPTGSFSSSPTQATSAPVLRLVPSLAFGIVSLVLNAVITFGPHEATDTSFAVLAIVAWVCAGILGISLLGWYFAENNRRKGAGLYIDVDSKKAVYAATLVVLAAAVLWSAIDIAQWAGKL